MKKFLIVAHYSRFLVQFEMNNVKILQDMGYEVHYATNYEQEDMYADAPRKIRESGVVLHQIDFVRSPYRIADNIKAYRQLVSLMEKEKFAGVHCHTPMAGALARLAANKTKTKPVLYTAHGFHFYKGCPIQNRLIYETAERFLARYTDAQITINDEDYQAAQTFKLRGQAYKIPGVGVEVKKIRELKVDRVAKRKELGIPEDAFVMISVGELNKNKNHSIAIKAFAKADIPNSYYIICGEGGLKSELKELSHNLNVGDRVKLLGFRKDVRQMLKISDLFVFPSFREGLSLSLMEALSAGIPCIASNIRGNRDLLTESELFEPADQKQLEKMMINRQGKPGLEESACMRFDVSEVMSRMRDIYNDNLKLKF